VLLWWPPTTAELPIATTPEQKDRAAYKRERIEKEAGLILHARSYVVCFASAQACESSRNMNTIGYVRVSTEEQAREGVSIDAQEAKIRVWADLNDAENVVIFRDAGLSGKRMDNRPGFQEAVRNVQRGDALVVHSLSRLSRSTKDTLAVAENLAARGADLVSLSEKIDTTTAAGKMAFRMLAVLLEFQRDEVSERTRLAFQHMRARGQKAGGDVPYGYRLRRGRLVENKHEQKGFALAQRLRRSGRSFMAVARQLIAHGYRSKRGLNHWHPATVRQMLERTALRRAAMSRAAR
jgi:site-specific DNA recombinase